MTQTLVWAPQQNISGFVSTNSPSLAVFGNRLFAACKGFRLLPRGEDDQGIYWSSFDGTGWAPRQNISGFVSTNGPSLAVFGNRLFAAFKGARYGGYDDQGIFWSSFDGTDWADPTELAGVGSAIGPSLAVFQDRLFATWKGAGGDQGIHWSSFDGTGWAPQQNIAGFASTNSPSLAVFGNRLFAAWKGATDQGIYWSSFDGTGWAPQQNIAGVGSAIGPSLAVFQDRLFAAWRGIHLPNLDDQGIYWSSFDGTGWAPQQNIAGVGSAIGPSLAVFQDRLFAAWKGATDQGIYWSSAQAQG